MAIKLLALMVLSCIEVGLLVGATAAEPIVTNKPAASAIVLRLPVELKGTNVTLASTNSSNQTPVLPRLTNAVENLSAEFGEAPLSQSALHADRFEWMNERPILQSRKMEPLRFLDRLPLRGGAVFSKNPNARRNPLEVDGW